MQLFFMELYKICRGKKIWIMTAILLVFMVILFCQAYSDKIILLQEFGEAAGYRKLLSILQYMYTVLSIWLIVVLAPLFAEDHASTVKDLVMSAQKGREGVYVTRIKASFAMTVVSFLVVTGITILICGMIFHYRGGELPVRAIEPYTKALGLEAEKLSITAFLGRYLLISFGAFFLLAAWMVFISASSKKVVYALLVSFFLYFAPVMFENIGRGTMNPIYVFVSGQPILLVTKRCMIESWNAYWWHGGIIMALILLALWYGLKNWNKKL